MLDDTTMLSEFFTIPTGMKLFAAAKEVKEKTTMELLHKTLGMFICEGPDPDSRLYDAAVHLVLSSVGIIKSTDDMPTSIECDVIDVDYGYGKGIGTTTRKAIASTSRTLPTDDVVERRCRALISVLMSMICRGMTKVAIDVFIVLSEDNILERKIPGPNNENEARDLVYDTFRGAPPFAKYLRLYKDQILAATEKTRIRRDNNNFDMCECGLPLIRVVVHDSSRTLTKTIYGICPVWVITEEGCKKTVKYDEK